MTVGKGAKANHLTYLGDGTVGAGANIGAGTIFCNYDGFDKWETHVGEGAFIGSNTALVGAGERRRRRVHRLGLGDHQGRRGGRARPGTRSKQLESPGWAARFRERKLAERAARKAKS